MVVVPKPGRLRKYTIQFAEKSALKERTTMYYSARTSTVDLASRLINRQWPLSCRPRVCLCPARAALHFKLGPLEMHSFPSSSPSTRIKPYYVGRAHENKNVTSVGCYKDSCFVWSADFGNKYFDVYTGILRRIYFLNVGQGCISLT